MFENETPLDINDWDVNDVWKLVKDEEFTSLSPKARLSYVKMLYDIEGFDLTPDAAFASIAMPPASLILATAGSGKTTLVQLKILLFKLILQSKFRPERKMMGKEILCLVYNKHNVPDMEEKQRQLVAQLKDAGVKGLYKLSLDDKINARTMHSFCDYWRRQYVAKMNMVGFKKIEESEAIATMSRAITLAYKMLNLPIDENVTAKNMCALYDLSRETLKTVDELQKSDKFIDMGVPKEVVEKCFERYEASKRMQKKYDYCDLLVSFYELLKNDEKIRRHVQTYYSAVVADEVQDFTPVMWRILQLMTDNGTPLTCIGDEDQCIYRFRGADIYDLLKFKEQFRGGKVYTLGHNRRCRQVILDEAMRVVSKNTLRFNKTFVGVKDGGSIEAIPYNSAEGQILSVVDTLDKMEPKDREDCVVCFKENACAQLLVELLEERKIMYHSLQLAVPFSHEIYRDLIDILNALESPFDRTLTVNLYKVLPCTKSQLRTAMGWDEKKKKFKELDHRTHFSQYDFGTLYQVRGFSESLEFLVKVSKMLPTENMEVYFPVLFEMFKKYFWNYVKTQHDSLSSDEIFEERAKKYFCVKKPFWQVFEQMSRHQNICVNNNSLGEGVTISTFHGLKGLEFKKVFVIYMDEEVYPNFSLIESKEYDESLMQELEESETRLWYVTLTRAIDSITIYYSKANPSRYVTDFLSKDEHEDLDDFGVSDEWDTEPAEINMDDDQSVVEEDKAPDLQQKPVDLSPEIPDFDFSNRSVPKSGDYLSNLIRSL